MAFTAIEILSMRQVSFGCANPMTFIGCCKRCRQGGLSIETVE